jgi:hypothetical protein
MNFRHHNPKFCTCADCTCGRHLCLFHAIKPDLSKKTVYKADYVKKKQAQYRININKEYERFRGPTLEVSSTYGKDFDGRTAEVERFRPTDTLKLEGPCQQLTSYSSGFPGHRGRNQYVRYSEQCTRGYFPMRHKSTYSQDFTGDQRKREQWDRVRDNLKTGSSWFGSTTYGNSFKCPNPEDYSSKRRVSEKLELSPNFSHQYGTCG